MHIVHLLPELQQGGVETVVLCLNRELVGKGHQSTVISAGGKLAAQIEADGGTHIELDICSKNPLSFIPRVRKLQTTLSSLSPSVLHVHSRVPAWLTWFANKKLELPWVTTVHGFNSVSRYSAIMTKGDRVICVSNPVKAFIQQNYGTAEERISVIHPGIDPTAFDPEKVDPAAVATLKTRFNLDGCFVVSSIGRITGLKDYETFIHAIGQAIKSNPNLRGLIAGHVRTDKQEYFEALQALITALNLNNMVHIATDLTDMPAIYTVSDVVVSCSKKPESFGLTLIEALAMGLPVIATRHGGPLDIISEDINGYFFEPGNADELAEKILRAPDMASSSFRNDVLRGFNIGKMANGTLAVYAELCT